MKELVELLILNKLTIASIESLTGGLFASEIVSVPNASQVYLGSIVTYANIIKQRILKIDKDKIDKYGVVSKEIATLMAVNGSQILKSDITVSFTGNAGPATLENKDLGLVFTCIKIKDNVYNFKDKLSGNRDDIRKTIVTLVKERLINILKEKGD